MRLSQDGGELFRPSLDRWTARIAAWASGGESDDAARERASRDVYCYFDNDTKAHAPFDARGTSGT
ncbi:hypothetical protein ADT25_04140 [Xanthomonas oryzae]|uniref:Uncharacterized protein n=1 Tax=Xanthomonas oryzae TaxID=347 RepID=A0AAP1EZT1_9XANT|nr:hypothetical protein ADT25_04140 [Xanthomonas oryzae]